MQKFTPTTDHIRVIPLGGLDQFGMNCCLLEFDDSLVMVDCGVSFPDATTPGVDYILPDWQWLLRKENLSRLVAIFITHGHEDHLGGLPFFLQQANYPVYTGRFTASLLRAKLEERPTENPVEIIEVSPGDTLLFDGFSVEFIHVNHSIPDAMSLSFHTALGHIIFTGDWKIDQTPTFEPPIDLHRFAELGKEGVIALLGDSTNALTSHPLSRSEASVTDGLASIIEHSDGRVLVALFSSNVHRVYSLCALAQKYGRRVAFFGRTLERNFALAQETGFIPTLDPDLFVEAEEIEGPLRDQLVVIMTGTQAEPRASLPRYAFGAHKYIKAAPTDTVILSARIIPGNESDIFKMLNHLAKQDVKVITAYEAPVHASGHARSEELKLLLTLTKPKYLVAMHGDYRIRKAHCELSAKLGCDPILINDGDTILLHPEGLLYDEPVPVGKIAVDGKTMNEVNDAQLRDRIKLSLSGIIIAIMAISASDGEILSGPDLLQRGFLADESNAEELLNEARLEALAILQEIPPEARLDRTGITEDLRLAVRRFFQRKIERKPIVIPFIHMV